MISLVMNMLDYMLHICFAAGGSHTHSMHEDRDPSIFFMTLGGGMKTAWDQ